MNWFTNTFFKKQAPKNETPEQKEQRLVEEVCSQMLKKLDFIKTDLQTTFPEKTDGIEKISQPIDQLKLKLLAAKADYENKENPISLEDLKKKWAGIIDDEETGLKTVENYLKTSSRVYHHVHEAIQSFFKWFQSTMQKLGVLSEPSEESQNKKPWIQEQENSPKNIKDIRGFEEGLDMSEPPKKEDGGTSGPPPL
ncbi:MAG: hypothetical protein K0U37_07460 [Gammaproteobacteria bacterium]|nr:hypothetical protein [Gammaproteobacteria bacterium]